jgi:hypothetical protein
MFLIALGSTACKVVDKFSLYPGYKVYKFDHDLPKSKFNLKVPTCQQFYEYEQLFTDEKLERFLKGVKGEALLVTCGSDPISLLSLRVGKILTSLCPTSVCYIKLDQLLVGGEKKEIERMVFEMLQNYTLSAYFQQMYLFNNTLIEKMCQGIDMFNYYDKVYEMVAWILHTNKSLKAQSSAFENLSKSREMGIKAFKLSRIYDGQEKNTFSLDKVTEERIYYIVDDKLIQENKELFNDIREGIKFKEVENKKVCYAVYVLETNGGIVLTEQQSLSYQK